MFAGLNSDAYDRQYSNAYLFKRMWSYFRPHSRRLGVITLMGLLLSGVQALVPIIIAAGIGVLQAGAVLDMSLLLVGALLATTVIQYVANWLRRRMISRLIGDITGQMRKDGLAAAVNRDMAFYDENKSGKIISRITSDTDDFGQVLVFSSDILTQLVQAVLLLVVLFTRNVPLTLVLLTSMPVIVAIAAGLRKWARKVTRPGFRAMAAVNDNIQESVTGISVAKNFRQEAAIYHEFTQVNQQSYNVNMRRAFVLSLVFPILNALAGIVTGMALYVGATYVIAGAIIVSEWYLFIQSVNQFFDPFISVAAFASQFQQALGAAERIFALIDAENTVRQNDHQPLNDLTGHIVFENVIFEYKPGARVLEEFNLEIKSGESLAFVGHTGAGKSTIARLITRFYEFQSGHIRVDGRDIRSFDLQAYRSRLGLVPQTPFLFSGTIMDNARYSRPQATDQEIEQIATRIGGGEWLETLPDGLHSDVGERGSRLSMGQRQLVSLLRVLVQRPAIFLLDEATASIDPFTEMQIQEALEMILQRATSILIAHRLSTVRSADRIIVLREGQIIEQGNHAALMAQGGHYAELYDTYFRHQSLTYIETARSALAGSD
jgi:ATP-binding cassette, subfamily B, bacterial